MENKIIFIIITSILVVTLIFNSVLIAKRVSKTYMYGVEYGHIVLPDRFTENIKNKGVFEDLYDFEKELYLSSLIILIFSLVIAILLLLAEFISELKNAFKGIVYKIFNIVNIVFCGVFAIIHFVFFCIWCAIIDTDKSFRKHYPIYKGVKDVKKRAILHLIFNLILFIILAIAAFLSFMAMKNETSSSGNSNSNNNTAKENKNKDNDNSKKQINENTAIKNNKENAGASERPLNLLTKDAPK
jgi:hypothetical protein